MAGTIVKMEAHLLILLGVDATPLTVSLYCVGGLSLLFLHYIRISDTDYSFLDLTPAFFLTLFSARLCEHLSDYSIRLPVRQVHHPV